MPEEIVNIINLDTSADSFSLNPNCPSEFIQRSREERIISIVRQSKQMGFPVRFWEGEICRGNFIDGRIGISRSFKKIVRWAKEKNMDRVTIGEDDLLFSDPSAWKHYLENIPEDYDLYLGGVYSGYVREGRLASDYAGHTLIMINKRFFDFFLSADENFHIDRWFGRHFRDYKFMVCEPFVVSQIPTSYSDNHKAMASHAALIEGARLYGR